MEINDKRLIVDCLLFASSVQVCANWGEEEQRRMLEIAKMLEVQPTKNIEFWKDEMESEEPWADQIPEHFDIQITGAEPKEPEDKETKDGD
jgi:hypothetical protein